jgi:hypothetical protein
LTLLAGGGTGGNILRLGVEHGGISHEPWVQK